MVWPFPINLCVLKQFKSQQPALTNTKYILFKYSTLLPNVINTIRSFLELLLSSEEIQDSDFIK